MWKEAEKKDLSQIDLRKLEEGDVVELLDPNREKPLGERIRNLLPGCKPAGKEAPVTITILDDDRAKLVVKSGSGQIGIGSLQPNGVDINLSELITKPETRIVRTRSIFVPGSVGKRVLWFPNGK